MKEITVSECSSKALNHLGLVAGMFDELKVAKSIDAFIPQDMKQRNISIGVALKAMVLNGLGFVNQRLYLLPHFFEGKPIAQLLGEGISAPDLNDDVMGRALDSIYEAGVTDVYRIIAKEALDTLGISGQMSHIDTTTFHTDGKYEYAEEDGVINITKGYSRDHRPELNQFGLQLIVEGQAGIPIMMEALSGNDNDKTRFKETVRNHIEQLKDDFSVQHLGGDSALYCADTIRLMDGLIWTSRVPETIAKARDLIEEHADRLAQDSDGETPNSVSVFTSYADVEQHWIVVYSPQAHARALHSVRKQYEKKSMADQRSFDALCKQDFACVTDALAAAEKLTKKLKISMMSEIDTEQIPVFNKPGRPAKNSTPDYYKYRISASLSSDHQSFQKRLKRKSCFILATNQTDTALMSSKQILADYKNQQKVERGFRFLKDPMFLASSVFLKSPKRIMALTMVMTVCLLVYAALEHRIRKGLDENDESFPNQTGKLIKKPTLRWVFNYFQNIQVLYINQKKTAILNLNNEHQKVLKVLGRSYAEFHS